MAFKVFVSYSTKDMEMVKLIEKDMKSTGASVFVAENSILPGSPLSSTIKENIISSDLFIVLWSKNSKESQWVSQEIGIAHSTDKLIIPVVLDENIMLPAFIKDIKYISTFENRDKAIEKLRQIVFDHVKKNDNNNILFWGGIIVAMLLLFNKE